MSLAPLVPEQARERGAAVAVPEVGPEALGLFAVANAISQRIEVGDSHRVSLPAKGGCPRLSSMRAADAATGSGVLFCDGMRALPEVTPLPSLSSPLPAGATLPSSSPVPVPGNAPLPAATSIPIPGASPITGVLVPAGSERRFAYFLQFTCIVFSRGEVVIVIDAADRNILYLIGKGYDGSAYGVGARVAMRSEAAWTGSSYATRIEFLTAASGSPAFAELIAHHDAFAIERLRAAGAICLGLTNMPPMAGGGMQRVNGFGVRDFDEIYASFRVAEGTSQSSRCAQCGVPSIEGFSRLHCHFCAVYQSSMSCRTLSLA